MVVKINVDLNPVIQMFGASQLTVYNIKCYHLIISKLVCHKVVYYVLDRDI